MIKGDFDIQKIEKAFERIKTSKLFKRSASQERILRYLIDQSLKGNNVKEQNIGADLLEENYNGDQNNSKVRVYVYNLRKKLDEYYKSTGKNEEIKFYIEKGQYNLTFGGNVTEKKKDIDNSYFNIRLSKKNVFVFFGAVAVLFSIFFLLWFNKETYLWKPYLSQDNSLCLIADKFVVSDRTLKKTSHFALYHDIIDANSLDTYSNQFPDLFLKQSSFTMLTKMAPLGVHYLDKWFHKFNNNFDIQLESEVQYSDYADKNVIYIGQSKYMTTSKSIFLKNSKAFLAKEDGYTYRSEEGLIDYIPKIGKVDYKEYTMVSYQKLDNGNYALFFVSNHDIGVVATLKMFTSEDKLKEFYKKIPHPNSEFNALFEVNGLQRNDMDCELIKLEVIN